MTTDIDNAPIQLTNFKYLQIIQPNDEYEL